MDQTKRNGKLVGTELWFDKQWAENYEVKDLDLDKDCENILRVYRSAPESWTFQIRTYKPIVNRFRRSGAKARNMIAHVTLSVAEVEEILAYMKERK